MKKKNLNKITEKILNEVHNKIIVDLHTEKDLIKFGNFLLSEERKQNTSKKNRKNVTDADLSNWKEKYIDPQSIAC